MLLLRSLSTSWAKVRNSNARTAPEKVILVMRRRCFCNIFGRLNLSPSMHMWRKVIKALNWMERQGVPERLTDHLNLPHISWGLARLFRYHWQGLGRVVSWVGRVYCLITCQLMILKTCLLRLSAKQSCCIRSYPTNTTCFHIAAFSLLIILISRWLGFKVPHSTIETSKSRTLPRELFSPATSNHTASSFQRPIEKKILYLWRMWALLNLQFFIHNSLQFM